MPVHKHLIIRAEVKSPIANEKGITVWLNWNSKTLIYRINRKKNKRPIASNLTNSKLKDLMLVRSKFYSKAKYKIECENMEKNEVVNIN